jgi:hypothetical protein
MGGEGMTPTPRAYLESHCSLAAVIAHRSAPKPTLAESLEVLNRAIMAQEKRK